MLHQWCQAFYDFGWHTRDPAGETGGVQAILDRSRPGASTLEQAEGKGLVRYGPLAMPDRYPDRISPAGQHLSRHSRGQRAKDHPRQEMTDQVAGGDGRGFEAVQDRAGRRGDVNRAKGPLVMRNFRTYGCLDRERGIGVGIVQHDVDASRTLG